MKTKLILVWAVAGLLSFRATAQTASKSIDNDILAANKVFMQAFEKGATAMGDLYASDAQLFPPNGGVINGSAAITPVWKGAFDAGVKKVTLETMQTEKAGDHIIETGLYTLASTDGKPIDSGKYMVVWKKEKGQWKLYRDIWNTSMAAK